MNFHLIFLDTVKYWPEEVLILDADLVDGNSGSFRTLSNLWEEVEKKTASLGILTDLMVWAIFCGLHRLAIERHGRKESRIFIRDIDLGYVKQKFEESFFGEENKELWKDYKG